MSDLIERQAAIDAIIEDKICDDSLKIMTTLGEGDKAETLNMTCDRHVKMLMSLPPAQPEQRWIPVTERLPEKDGRYQVTRYDYVANTEFIDILWYEENLWWNRHSTGDYAVTAWMPLPEPYKEGGADG